MGMFSGFSKNPNPSNDISAVLKDWDYEPETINVRKILGVDGKYKLQLRLDLGLLQMETEGRPDGKKPFGFDSLLDYFNHQLEDYSEKNGTPLGFHVNPRQCQLLRQEATMYYNRYLSFFVLGEYAEVARDTERNLKALDFCFEYAIDEQDRLFMEQYRPYIIRMRAQALSTIESENGNYAIALNILRDALRQIKEFFARFKQLSAYRHSSEVRVLKKLAREIKTHIPQNPLDNLQKELKKALKEERYEDAARIRDEIEKIQAK